MCNVLSTGLSKQLVSSSTHNLLAGRLLLRLPAGCFGTPRLTALKDFLTVVFASTKPSRPDGPPAHQGYRLFLHMEKLKVGVLLPSNIYFLFLSVLFSDTVRLSSHTKHPIPGTHPLLQPAAHTYTRPHASPCGGGQVYNNLVEEPTVSYWCFIPGVAMTKVVEDLKVGPAGMQGASGWWKGGVSMFRAMQHIAKLGTKHRTTCCLLLCKSGRPCL